MSAPLRIYGDERSGNCLKVKWVAELRGMPYEWIELDVFNRATRTPEFLALNPAGQVPTVILSDGRALAQSNAIMLHLAEGSPLIPADAYDRARMLEWLFWEQYSHEPCVAVRISQKAYLGKRDDEIDPALLTKGNAALARMEQHLSESPYLVRETLSLADIGLVAYTRKAGKGGFDLSQYPSVSRWIARVEGDLGLDPAG